MQPSLGAKFFQGLDNWVVLIGTVMDTFKEPASLPSRWHGRGHLLLSLKTLFSLEDSSSLLAGSITWSWLSSSPIRWSVQHERASGLAECYPGLWMRDKSNLAKRGTSVLSGGSGSGTLGSMWVRWSFKISMVCLVPSRMCLHSSRPQMTDRSSLLWIL